MLADKVKVKRLLNTAKGQLEGILRMIDEDRYCMDIVNQIMASQAILGKASKEILHAHLNHCVYESINSQGGEEKIKEITALIDKLIKV